MIRQNPTLSSTSLVSSISLSLVDTGQIPDEDDYETSLYGLAAGTCIDFQRGDHIFIVGTEEGSLHKCSKAYNGRFLESYEGHQLAVYSVHWNPFHRRIFMSCGADWCVKIWDHTQTTPLLTFDLKVPVCDAKWAPYSSSVFALLTADGKVSVYDLARSKHEPLCNQLITRAIPTHLLFSPVEPLLLVGDSSGRLHSFKISPNLRNISIPNGLNNSNGSNSADSAATIVSALPSTSFLLKTNKSTTQSTSTSPGGKSDSIYNTETGIYYEGATIGVEQEITKLDKILMVDNKGR